MSMCRALTCALTDRRYEPTLPAIEKVMDRALYLCEDAIRAHKGINRVEEPDASNQL